MDRDSSGGQLHWGNFWKVSGAAWHPVAGASEPSACLSCALGWMAATGKLGRKAAGDFLLLLCSTLEITAQRALPITYLGTSSPVKIKPPGPSASSKRPRSPCRCPLPLPPPHFRPFSAHHVQSLWLGVSSRFIRPGLRESNRWKANILVIQSQSVGTLLILLSTFSQFVLLL